MPGGNGGSSWFTGRIDDIAVYDHPLTDRTVAEHHALRPIARLGAHGHGRRRRSGIDRSGIEKPRPPPDL
ncbi:hypothetical protein ACWEQL_08355 [Kitasatospora sp. NPDC004240]